MQSKCLTNLTDNININIGLFVLNHCMNLIVNNRDLLRKYKDLREKLINGEVDEIVVPQKGDSFIKISLVKNLSPYQQLAKKLKIKPLKNLERPNEDIL